MMVEGFNGAYQEPPGAFALPEVLTGREDRPDTGRVDADAPVDRQDAYFPADRADRGEAQTEHAAALERQAEAEMPNHYCYCGVCAACKARAGEAEPRARSDDRADDEKTDRESDEDKKPGELTESEERQVEDLEKRDREVRQHEQAHVAAGAKNLRYDFQVGPDGKSYAVGGTCDVDFTAMSNDHDTRVAGARSMRAAALAPADPSAQDMATAAEATRLEQEAMREQSEELINQSFS